MKFRLLVILFCSILFCSCKKEHTTFHENGQKHEVYNQDDKGLKHGVYQKFSLDGSLYEEAHYTHGKLDGTRFIYHPSGSVDIKEYYLDDKLEGDYKQYNEKGVLIFEATYTNNVLGGIVKTYFEDASLKEEVTFESNEENGPFTEFHPNGKIHWKGNYLNGDNEIGVLEEYDLNGTLIKKMDCNGKGICKTTWTLEKGDVSETKKDA